MNLFNENELILRYQISIWRELGGLEVSRAVLELRNAFYRVLPEYRKIKINLMIVGFLIVSSLFLDVTAHNTLSRIWSSYPVMRPVSVFII